MPSVSSVATALPTTHPPSLSTMLKSCGFSFIRYTRYTRGKLSTWSLQVVRPTVMTNEVVDQICKQIAEGKSLRSICKNDDMPALSTVMLAVVQDRDGFRSSYAHAREAAGYAHGDGVIEVVEAVRNGDVDAQTARAMMDGLKWAAERMAPKSHSSRQEIDHTTKGESINRPASELSDDELAAIAAANNKTE